MDKSNNRTDLMAAGRKKLQQFRQNTKKGNKSSKSSKKAAKPDGSTSSSAEPSVTQRNVANGEISTLDVQDNIASSNSRSMVDLVAADSAASFDAFSTKDNSLETSSPVVPLEFPSEGSGMAEMSLNQSADEGYDIDSGTRHKNVISILDPKDERLNAPGISDPFFLGDESSGSSKSVVQHVTFSSPMEGQNWVEQVTDVGAMQEVGSSSWIHVDEVGITQSEVHDSIPAEFTGTGDLWKTEVEDTIHVAVELSEGGDVSSTDVSIHASEEVLERHNHLGVPNPPVEPEAMPPSSFEMSDQQEHSRPAAVSNEEEFGLRNVPDGHGGRPTDQASSGVSYEDSYLESEADRSKPSGLKQVDFSSSLHGSSFTFSHLAEILQNLKEDEFRLLLRSREPSTEGFTDAGKMKFNDSVVSDAFERLKEQLYVATLSRDAFHLELSEHQNVINEISAVNVSLEEVQRDNEVLTRDIAHCRYELHEVISTREEVEKQLHFSEAEVEVLSSELKELQGEMSSLSTELVDCRNLVEGLSAENASLKGSLKAISEEKYNLLVDNERVMLENAEVKGDLARCETFLESLQKERVDLTENLTLLRDDKRQLEEEKDYILHEKDSLLVDLAEYKTKLEALTAEKKNFNEEFTSLAEKMKKLGEEKESAIHQTEELSIELIDCKELVLTLQKEISNLNSSLKSIEDGQIKIEEEKKYISLDYEKQSDELAEIKLSEADWQLEHTKALNDLKKATFRISQLAEENEVLKMNVEIFKSNVKEVDHKQYYAEFVEVAKVSGESTVLTAHKHNPGLPSPDQLELSSHDDFLGFVALRKRLKDAGHVIQKLDRAIGSMHLYSISLSTSNDNTAASGVSKLIQAFESKSITDDQDAEELPSETEKTKDPYLVTKVVLEDLVALLKDMVTDTENASEFCKELKQGKLLSDAVEAGLRSNYNALEDHTDQIEESNIELIVLYEVIRDKFCDFTMKEAELRGLCDALQNQEVILKSENSHLREKLNGFQVKIYELQSQLDEKFRDGEEMVTSLSDQVLALQMELVARESILEEEWNSVVAQVLQTVSELDAAVEMPPSDSSAGGTYNTIDFVSSVASSVGNVTKVIKDLHRQIEAAQRDRQAVSDACDDLHEQNGDLQLKHEMASHTLRRLYYEINELVTFSGESENTPLDQKGLDLLSTDGFSTLLDLLKEIPRERFKLLSANEELNSELARRERSINELEKQCLKANTIMESVENIEQYLRNDGVEIHIHDEPVSRIEYLIYLLFQKYKEAVQGWNSSTYLEMQLSDQQGQLVHLNSTLLHCENENLVFKHSLKTAEEDVASLNSKVQEKVAELELSEQRVASLREKLSLAVAKGKGLVSQRDSLKHSLAETSNELEKCSQELISRDASLHEFETKLEVYAASAERAEALESELSYIRNSATALRESFLLKDSVLQRIEEILEDLELPEHFHSGDIIEKIDWLGKSVIGNMPRDEWDVRSSAGGGSYSDAGLVGEGVKEEMMANQNSNEDLRGRYQELERNFYGLAEQNEMLEQSLMERNNLVQQWEEILGRVNIPSPLQSLEPLDKLLWLEAALSEAKNQCGTLQRKIDGLDNFYGSLSNDLENSQRRMSELDAAFQQVCVEKEVLSKDLKILNRDNDENSKKAAALKIVNENLLNEVTILQEQRLLVEKDIQHTDGSVKRLQELVVDALQSSSTEDVVIEQEGVNNLEELLRNLIEKYKALSSAKYVVGIGPTDDMYVTEKGEPIQVSRDFGEQEVAALSKKLDDTMADLTILKEEKDTYMLNNQSLLTDVGALETKKNELQQLLNMEEQKSASLREKLNVAVRKGKSLVQQRDGMKQEIEKLNTEVERLKSESKHTEKAISDYEELIKDLSTSQERVRVTESDNVQLKARLAETEYSLQEKEDDWSSIMDALGEVGLGSNSATPVVKPKEIGRYLHEIHSSLDSAEQESRKSKRASELLLAELNEVQERNDILQEELSEVSRDKDLAETAKCEALSHIEKLLLNSQDKERQLSEFMELKSGVIQMREDIFATEKELGDVLSRDLKVLHNIEEMMKSFLQLHAIPDISVPFPHGITGNFTSMKSENKLFMTEFGSLREQLNSHSHLLHEDTCRLSEVFRTVHRMCTSQNESYEFLAGDVKRLKSIEKEKESKLNILRGNMSLLYDACTSIIMEIENWKNHIVGTKSPGTSIEENDMQIFSEQGIKVMRDKLLFCVRDCMNIQSEIVEDQHRDMKTTLVNLHKELQDKDIQRERICTELVNHIKEAEMNANNYLHDLHKVRDALRDSQSQVDVMKGELKDQETNSNNLQQKVNSLTDALAAKDQENEALMQALDEEENQIEDLRIKIETLESEVQQKEQGLEKLEISRGKALKKLSVTVSKFDELHGLSESLLSEVEKLQSQLQERDGEISFLRQEVTRCTNDALSVTHMSKTDEIHDLLMWLDSLISRNTETHQGNDYKDTLQKQIAGLVSELENLRIMARNNDLLLQQEKIKVEEFSQKEEFLRNSLREKESQIVLLQDSGEPTTSTSEIVEVEKMKNNWAPQGSITQQVRSLRKTNNDQVAIAIDMDDDRLEDDDDDKAHGFKSLTTSKIVPRFTRPISDMVDGLWVSCDRALMRQPALRLGVILYWALLHSLLAAFVV